MKQLKAIIFFAILSTGIFAQAPEKMSFQAVIRDASNNLITNSPIGMQISILQGSISGSAVYVETQTPTTSINGLISIEVGAGNVLTGNFSSIDWSTGPYFIKTETDPTGGTNYTISGTQQLLSVPYALYAKTAGSSTPSNLAGVLNQGNDGGAKQIKNILDPTDPQDAVTLSFLDSLITRIESLEDTRCHDGIKNGSETGVDCGGTSCAPCLHVQQRLDAGQTPISIYNSDNSLLDSLWGKTYQGGLIFHLNTTTGAGLIAHPGSISYAAWDCWVPPNNSLDINGALGTALGTGLQNTIDIITSCSQTDGAAYLAYNFTSGAYSDWYLPSSNELALMRTHLYALGHGGFGTGTSYWSSTESATNAQLAVMVEFSNNTVGEHYKGNTYQVTAIRSY